MPKDSLDFGLRDFGAFRSRFGFSTFVAYLSWLFGFGLPKIFGLDSKCAVKVVLHT